MKEGEQLSLIRTCGEGGALQTIYLNELCRHSMSVVVYLMSGESHAGKIDSFDQHTVLLSRGDNVQLIYKHTIASIKTVPKALAASTGPPSVR
jgi:RNA chaperone Hfq